ADLGSVVGVDDVDDLAGRRHEARERALVEGESDVLDRVEAEKPRVDLSPVRVDRVEGHPLGAEQSLDIALELEEGRIEALGRVDAVDELDDALLVGQPLLQDKDRVVLSHVYPGALWSFKLVSQIPGAGL